MALYWFAGNSVSTGLDRFDDALRWNVERFWSMPASAAVIVISWRPVRHRTSFQANLLDLDATDDPLDGGQEGRPFNAYYKRHCASVTCQSTCSAVAIWPSCGALTSTQLAA
jgi:hypothetical protein